MTSVVLIHGAFNELWGPNELASRWVPALQDGVWHAGGSVVRGDATICFYGDLFRRQPETDDAAEWTAKRSGVEDMLASMAGTDALHALNEVAGKQTYDRTVDMFTMMAEDPTLADKVKQRLLDVLSDDTRVLVAHSLGTVVAVRTLTDHPDLTIDTLITLGSPLGSGPFANFCDGKRPPGVQRWVNVVATTDPVAAVGRVPALFGSAVEEHVIDNGHRGHAPEPYLNSAQVGHAVAAALVVP